MKSARTIEIIVSPDGSTQIETKGFAGESCRDASRFLEESLGGNRHGGIPPLSAPNRL
mgnify:CR=1 FL=1